ncbi:MAG: primosomal protein N', partial [Prevotella sp.]|nr:primosomal protein N' [Prevotella sp.]
MRYVDVILPLPIEGLFTYSITDEMAEKVRLGMRVLVPLGKSKMYTAIAVKVHDVEPTFDVKDVVSILDEHPILLPQQYQLWTWISDYYMSPIGEVYKAALPSGLKAEEGYRPKTETYIGLSEKYRNERALHIALDMLGRADKQRMALMDFLSLTGWGNIDKVGETPPVVEVTRDELMNESHCTYSNVKSLIDKGILYTYKREVGRLAQGGEVHLENIKKLNAAQQDAYNQVLFQMMRKNVVLLHGVTSSGKTEIYIHLIHKALQENKQVLYLVPEIALTVQMMERLKRVFGNQLGIYHSRYSDDERVEIWKKQLSKNPYQVILGARSAVFLPFHRLGLVIVDEEHETSFKQQEPAPRYHARSAAIMLAHMYADCQAKVLLGTATPSMESYYNATQGKYGLVELHSRYKDIALPEIQLVDIKDLRRRKMMKGSFSPQLLASVREALHTGKQVILFQNRRGFAPMIECKVCGWVPKCEHCDVSLTFHRNMNQLTCHYCGFTYAVPNECPCCGNKELKGRGYGTEKIEDEIMEIFP